FFSSRRRHTRWPRDWSSDVCSSDLDLVVVPGSQWVFASAFAGSGGVRLISVADHTTTVAYPASTSKDRLDAKTYDTCPGPPDARSEERRVGKEWRRWCAP